MSPSPSPSVTKPAIIINKTKTPDKKITHHNIDKLPKTGEQDPSIYYIIGFIIITIGISIITLKNKITQKANVNK